jgi:hypothetical protein
MLCVDVYACTFSVWVHCVTKRNRYLTDESVYSEVDDPDEWRRGPEALQVKGDWVFVVVRVDLFERDYELNARARTLFEVFLRLGAIFAIALFVLYYCSASAFDSPSASASFPPLRSSSPSHAALLPPPSTAAPP